MAPKVSQWFLTYPKCDASKEELLNKLQSIDEVIHYVIAREQHKDGDNHLHSYVKFASGVVKTKFLVFDFDNYHGQYEPCRSPKAVIKYCSKEDDFISDFDVKQYVNHKGKLSVAVIKNKSVKLALEDGDISFMQARAYVYARSILMEPLTRSDVCGVWFHGPPGCGKTHKAKQLFPNAYIKSQNKWWDGYAGETSVTLEDLDTHYVNHLLKIWADKWPCSGEVKGGSVQLRHKWFVITSNYTIREIVERGLVDGQTDDNLVEALERRFKCFEFGWTHAHPVVGTSGPGQWLRTVTPDIDENSFPLD